MADVSPKRLDRRPLILSMVALASGLLLTFLLGLRLTGGAVSYVLDDAYIHMAISKNLAEHGVWGVTRQAFTSSSSSLLWTTILAGLFKILGPQEWIPLALNACLALGTLIFPWLILTRRGLGAGLTTAFLLGIALLTPLTTLSFTGQEHVLQTLITLPFLALAARELARDTTSEEPSGMGILYLLGPLSVLTRFEGLFQVFIVCCLFLLRRRVKHGVLLGFITLLPLGLFGAYSVAQGWYPLPNSVLMKGNLTRVILGVVRGSPLTLDFWQNLASMLGFAAFKQLMTAPHVLFLILGGLLLYVRRALKGRGFWERDQLILFLFGATTLFHMELAKVGWFFRYEAYLVALGLMAIGVALGDKALELPWRPAASKRSPTYWGALAVVALLPTAALGSRALDAMINTPRATKNIHEQQYQMGRFVAEHYEGETITANDIGAINYLGDIGCVDLVGLASMEAAKRRRAGTFNQKGMEEMASSTNSPIAIAYEPWLVKWGGVPTPWVKVGAWRIPDNVVVAFDTVTFYATSQGEVPRLKAALKAFSPSLPEDVEESGAYLLP